ncbi:SMP-30/gluconolactonase/LRE family protein [Parapedobacter sp.]
MSGQQIYQILPIEPAQLGEGPVWDDQLNRLFWVDIVNGRILVWYPETSQVRTFNFTGQIGAVALTSQPNRVIAATDKGFAMLDLYTGKRIDIGDPETDLHDNRFNDGKCDSRGRFWAGSLNEEGRNDAALYMLDPSGTISKKIAGVSCSNGLAWSSDDRTFYYIDTPTRQVVAYDFDVATAAITNRRVAIDVDPADGLPDGMTIDSEGMLWVALWGGWKVVRWNPHTGEKLQEIKLPVSQVTSCAFGGKDLRDLYITSAKKALTPAALAAEPHAGALFVVGDIGVQGVAPARAILGL